MVSRDDMVITHPKLYLELQHRYPTATENCLCGSDNFSIVTQA